MMLAKVRFGTKDAGLYELYLMTLKRLLASEEYKDKRQYENVRKLLDVEKFPFAQEFAYPDAYIRRILDIDKQVTALLPNYKDLAKAVLIKELMSERKSNMKNG